MPTFLSLLFCILSMYVPFGFYRFPKFSSTELSYCNENPNTCENSGKCISLTRDDGSFRCLCPNGFHGKHCEMSTEHMLTSSSTPRITPPPLLSNTSEMSLMMNVTEQSIDATNFTTSGDDRNDTTSMKLTITMASSSTVPPAVKPSIVDNQYTYIPLHLVSEPLKAIDSNHSSTIFAYGSTTETVFVNRTESSGNAFTSVQGVAVSIDDDDDDDADAEYDIEDYDSDEDKEDEENDANNEA